MFRRIVSLILLSVVLVACGTPAAPAPIGPPSVRPASDPPAAATEADPPATAAAPEATEAFPPSPQSSPQIGACPVFPLDNIWNTPVDTLPVHPRSAQYIASIGASTGLHPDFGAAEWDGGPIGIPFVVVPSNQAPVAINFVEFDDESDPGPYPIPSDAPREYGGDHHVLVVREGECKLYELYHATRVDATHWNAGSGAVYDLRSNTLRPDGWTSADAAGLPILPGLVRYEEVQAGEIKHAIRFTVDTTQNTYVWPARHYASDNDSPSVPPMGQRFRLKASVNISGYGAQTQVILRAMKKYGLIIADNGSDWYISGAPNAGWNDDDLVSDFGAITGDMFEAVDSSALQVGPDSGQVAGGAAPQPYKIANRGTVVQNDMVSYAINLVGASATVNFSDALPAELTYVPGSASIAPATLPAPSFGSNAVQWSGSLPNSQTAVLTFQATVNTAARQAITNQATITSGGSQRTVAATIIANGLRTWSPLVTR